MFYVGKIVKSKISTPGGCALRRIPKIVSFPDFLIT